MPVGGINKVISEDGWRNVYVSHENCEKIINVVDWSSTSTSFLTGIVSAFKANQIAAIVGGGFSLMSKATTEIIKKNDHGDGVIFSNRVMLMPCPGPTLEGREVIPQYHN